MRPELGFSLCLGSGSRLSLCLGPQAVFILGVSGCGHSDLCWLSPGALGVGGGCVPSCGVGARGRAKPAHVAPPRGDLGPGGGCSRWLPCAARPSFGCWPCSRQCAPLLKLFITSTSRQQKAQRQRQPRRAELFWHSQTLPAGCPGQEQEAAFSAQWLQPPFPCAMPGRQHWYRRQPHSQSLPESGLRPG